VTIAGKVDKPGHFRWMMEGVAVVVVVIVVIVVVVVVVVRVVVVAAEDVNAHITMSETA